MIFPKFPKGKDKIGIIAPSRPMFEDDKEGYLLSFKNLEGTGFELSFGALSNKIIAETAADKFVSGSGKARADELHAALSDPGISYIVCQSGGDFLIDMLPYIDYECVKANPKWIQGYSDPTGLLYSVTTLCDIATVYGTNGGGFDMHTLHPSLVYSLDFIKGKHPTQYSFELYEGKRGEGDGYLLNTPVKWESFGRELDMRGRLIGGCMDCLSDIFGTPFDGGADFVERYAEDGVIWYFDIFAMKAEQVHNFLAKMKASGYFKNTRGYVFGRVLFSGSDLGISYEYAIKRALGADAPLVMGADIGHVKPTMTLVNGAIAKIAVKEGRASLELCFE